MAGRGLALLRGCGGQRSAPIPLSSLSSRAPRPHTQPSFLAAYPPRPLATPGRLLGVWRSWASGPATPPPPGDGPNPEDAAPAASSSAAPADAELSDGGAPPSPDELAAALAEQEAELAKARTEVRER